MMAETNTPQVNQNAPAENTVINVKYIQSWQGVLKIFKILCLFACLVSSAINSSNCKPYVYYYHYPDCSGESYGLAASVIGLVLEATVLFIYLFRVNSRWSGSVSTLSILFLMYHVVMFIMVYAACIVMVMSQPYNAFGILALAGFGFEIYFNAIWLKGGPEITPLIVS